MKTSNIIINDEQERKEILNKYRGLLRACKPFIKQGNRRLIRLAFEMSLDAHKNMRRRSGEPYIYHPIAVAQIVAEEIGLGTTSVVCALLHDVVEDTDISLATIEREFGKPVAQIVDGLTKISGISDKSVSIQAENFRKMLLTLADDARVILIKIADRLHNMRTMDSMPKEKQLKICSETEYLYIPLAHRLGLYAIKSELEDLTMKYMEPEVYKNIARKLRETKAKRGKFIKEFIEPIQQELEKQGLVCEVKGRPKSIRSIYNKMQKQAIEFEQVYDLFAIRIILQSPPDREKSDCWKAYSIVTDFYQPNPNRLRDWISTPKANGYESLHTTVMAKGKWVEVQIRTSRMNEIAEKGFAAHWKYKESGGDNSLDEWIKTIRELIENPEPNALEFVDNFKLNLYNKDLFVFTPKGDLTKLPFGATALDFAFDIHTEIGEKCIGAKVNHKIVPLSHVLQNGDQVEIITSNIQKPKPDWLNYVITAKAKTKIKQSLKDAKRKEAEIGKETLIRKFRHWKLQVSEENINKLLAHFKLISSLDLYYLIAIGKIEVTSLKDILLEVAKPDERIATKIEEQNFQTFVQSPSGKNDDLLIIDEKISKIDYSLAPCCNPIPGDDVFGFVTISEGIKIHRVTCPNAVNLLSRYGYRVVKAKWTQQHEISFLAGIKIIGLDDIGIISNLSSVISTDMKVNMRSISVLSNDGMFEGTLMVYVNDTKHLEVLMQKLKNVKGVEKVTRFETHA